MSIISDCIKEQLPEIEDYKRKREDWLDAKHLEAVPPLDDPSPNTHQIIQVGAHGIECLEDSRKAQRKVETFIRRHWPENKDAARSMKRALEATHKAEALFKEALEACQLTETDFVE